MEFRQALRDIVISKNVNLTDDESDKAVLVAFGSYCASNSEMLQMQELKNILSTGTSLGQALLQAYLGSRREGDSSYKAVADKIEEIADELEKNNISCFSYAYFISCYLDLFKELYKHDDFLRLDIDSIAWIDPEKYDYGYQSMPTAEKTFGFGRYRASIKEFRIENGVLERYTGHDPYVVIPYFVKSIGKGAFAGNQKIRSVYIPRAVSKIGAEAFFGCEKLETVVLSEAVTQLYSATFEECKVLKRINLSNVTSVGNRCFKGCVKLENVDMPALTKVGDEAFSYCIALKSTGFISRLNQIGCKAFARCPMNYVSLDGCSRLGAEAFLNCTSLTRIALNSNITSMGTTPFMGCTAVTLLNISGDSYTGYIHDLFAQDVDSFNQQFTALSCVKKDFLKNSEFAGYTAIKEVEIRRAEVVPDGAFAGCGALTAVKFGSPIKAIGQSAFASCVSLADIDMQFVGEELSAKAFYKCGKLDPGHILGGVRVIGDFALAYTDLSAFSFERSFKRLGAFAFANAAFPARISLDLSGCEVLPGAFHGVGEILTLRLDTPRALYKGQLHLLFDADVEAFAKRKINYLFVNGSIAEQSFKDYSNIRYIEFAAEDGRIPAEAFANCSSLESVRVNGEISLIEPYAFSECTSLSMLDMQYGPVVVGRSAFSGCKHIHDLIDLSRVTRFGEYSFAGTDIQDLILGEDVLFIGRAAFSACADIEKVVLPFVGCMPQNAQAGTGRFGVIFGSDEFETCNVQRLTNGRASVKYYIPGGIKSVTVLSQTLSEGCFDGCGFLTEVCLPNIVDFSGAYFRGCNSLRDIRLGKALENFSATAILGCERAVRVDVSPECEKYVCVNGTVLSAAKDKLYFLDAADTLSDYIASVRAIGSYAVAHAPIEMEMPPSLREIEPYAINCTNARSITVDAVENIMESAFYNCDALEAVSITDSGVRGAFAFSGSQPVIGQISLSGMALGSIAELFTGIENIAVDTLSLDGISISGSEFFEKIAPLRAIEIKSPITAAPACMHGLEISSLSMCGQPLLASELLGEGAHLSALCMHDAEIRKGEFKGITVDELVLEDIAVIRGAAFAGACIRKLTVRNVAQIEPGAFAGSSIEEFSIEDDEYQYVDGILYHKDDLVYCFGKKIQNLIIPNYVKHVCAGAIDSVTELRQISVLHSDVLFERQAVVNCTKLNAIELVEISNKVLREIFDSVSGISFIKYSGRSIKRKFFSHMDHVCEVQLIGVTEINDFAFGGDSAIETVSGLNTATYIGDMAFADCESLRSIVLSKSCNHIGVGAFEGCFSLARVAYPVDSHQVEFDISAAELFGEEISASLKIEIIGGDIPAKYFENVDADIVVTASPRVIGEKAFKNSGLTQISLADTVDIGAAAFSGSEISTADMPRVTRIGADAFGGCVSLTSVSLNNNVEYLGENWIAGAPVANLSGAEAGQHYRTGTDYLVDQATSTLVYMAPDSSITDIVIDKAVKRITASAFHGSGVVTLDAAAVIEIEAGAFARCNRLEGITLRALCAGDKQVPLSFFFGSNRAIKSVKVIGGELVDGCFEGFDKLETAHLPNNIKHISKRCFAGCKRLVRVDGLTDVESFGETPFEGCVSLEALDLPFLGADSEHASTLGYLFGKLGGLGLKEIRVLNGSIVDKAFAGCSSLVLVSLPKEIEKISAGCFGGCSNLERIVNVESVKRIGAGAFANCGSLRSVAFARVEVVGDEAFVSCSGLIELTLPGSAKQIGKGILNGCTSLAKLTVAFTDTVDNAAALGRGASNGLKEVCLVGGTLGKHAFAGCDKLESVVLSDSVKKISDSAFAGCIKLTAVTCSSGITEIGDMAFLNCYGLSGIELSASLSSIGREAFSNSGFSGSLSLENVKEIGVGAFCGSKIKAVTLGDKLKVIQASTFENCEELESVILTEATKTVEAAAFSGCRSLNDIRLEDMVFLGEKSFYKCESLGQISLLSLEALGISAFEECKAIKTVTFNDLLPEIPERAFAGCTALCRINVPAQLTAIGNRAFAATAMKKLELRVPYSLVTVGEYIFENAHSPIIYATPNQTAKWDLNWGADCKGHGLFNLSRKVITKKL